jgi:hypothetical protein
MGHEERKGKKEKRRKGKEVRLEYERSKKKLGSIYKLVRINRYIYIFFVKSRLLVLA